MNADEAKKKSLSVTEGKNREQMENVRKAIAKAVNEGQFKTSVYFSLLPGVTAALKNEGYTVKPFKDTSCRNESSTEISWL